MNRKTKKERKETFDKTFKMGQNGIQAKLEFMWNIKKNLFWEKRNKTIE